MGALIFFGLLIVLYLASSIFRSGKERPPPGTPEIVVVTVLDDESMSEAYKEKVKKNRNYYAEKQGKTMSCAAKQL